MPDDVSAATGDDARGMDRRGKIGDLAAEAGIQRVHMLAWRDLADMEAGGSELHASTVAGHWAEAGIDVVMRTSYAQGSPPESVRDGYEVVRRAGRYAIFPRAVLAELFGRHGRRDALVEIWNGVPFFSPLWARGPRATWLHHVHEDMWPMVLPPRLARFGQVLERRLAPPFYRHTPVVTLSESSRQHIIDRMGLPPDRLHVVNPGVDAVFTPGRSAETPLVIAIGRLMPAKDFPALVRAMVPVREAVPDVELVIVGEGYERETIEREIAAADAEAWITLAGRIDDADLLDLYRRAWVVASTSRAEGWGMTLTEAAACGTPAVATRIPGHIDAVADGDTGILVDRDDELSGAITALLTDHGRRERMSDAAAARSDLFRWDRTAYETLAVLAGRSAR
ncbi:MAG: glycosyltransferase family 4 protein [Actinomycetota bacterium]